MKKLAIGLFIILIAVIVVGSQYEKQRHGMQTLKLLEQELIKEVLVKKVPQAESSDPIIPNSQVPQQSLPRVSMSVQQYQEKITIADRVKVAEVVARGLTYTDVSHLLDLSKAGITSEEKQEIKQILVQKLTASEIDQLREIYKKYQGE